MAVHRQEHRRFDTDEVLGIGIAQVTPDQRHVGIIYRADGGPPRMCHLAWHHDLRDEELPSKYLWGGSGLDAANRAVMAAYVSLLQQNAAAVPYGIEYIGPCFDDAGRYIDQPIGYGLTCATFILDVFARRGFDLLQLDRWPDRTEDEAWQRQVIDGLAKNGGSEAHVEAMRGHVGARRFRPEEVAAGVISDDVPMSFDDAIVVAKEIVRDVKAAVRS